MLTIELPFIGVLALAEASDGSQGLIDLPLVLWTGVTFVIVLFTLKQFAWGPILEQLERREGAIRGAIEGAERERGEAAGLREQYEQRLQGSREEGQVLIEEAREDARKIRDRGHREGDEARQQQVEAASREISMAKAKALNEVTGHAGSLALDIARRVVGRSISDADGKRLVDEALREIEVSGKS